MCSPRCDFQVKKQPVARATGLSCAEAAGTFLNSAVPRKNHKAGFKITRLFLTVVNGPFFTLASWQIKPFRDLSVLIFRAFSLHTAGLEGLVLVREGEIVL